MPPFRFAKPAFVDEPDLFVGMNPAGILGEDTQIDAMQVQVGEPITDE